VPSQGFVDFVVAARIRELRTDFVHQLHEPWPLPNAKLNNRGHSHQKRAQTHAQRYRENNQRCYVASNHYRPENGRGDAVGPSFAGLLSNRIPLDREGPSAIGALDRYSNVLWPQAECLPTEGTCRVHATDCLVNRR
jgi:hypothetical protein